jgi:hypothetical protein
MVLTLYGPFQEDAYTYPACTPFDQDDVQFAYDKYYSYYESGVHVRMRELGFALKGDVPLLLKSGSNPNSNPNPFKNEEACVVNRTSTYPAASSITRCTSSPRHASTRATAWTARTLCRPTSRPSSASPAAPSRCHSAGSKGRIDRTGRWERDLRTHTSRSTTSHPEENLPEQLSGRVRSLVGRVDVV